MNSALCVLSKQHNVAARPYYAKGYSKFINVDCLFTEIITAGIEEIINYSVEIAILLVSVTLPQL